MGNIREFIDAGAGDELFVTLKSMDVHQGMVFKTFRSFYRVVSELGGNVSRAVRACSVDDGTVKCFTDDDFKVVRVTIDYDTSLIEVGHLNPGDLILGNDGESLIFKRFAERADILGLMCDVPRTGDERILFGNAIVVRVDGKRSDERSKENFLDPLIKKLGITNIYSKRILAAMVFCVLCENACGITDDNRDLVKKQLASGLCGMYEFEALCLAATQSHEIFALMSEHEKSINASGGLSVFCIDYLWPFLRENEIIPGVIMPMSS